MAQSNFILIGIDGGASKVSAHLIQHDDNGFYLGKHNSTKQYSDYPEFQNDFTPINLKIQLSELSKNSIRLTKEEGNQAQSYYRAIIDAITELSTKSDNRKILIGIGMPGIKSKDGRGIVAIANGPRMPNFATEIETRLDAKGVSLITPIFKIGSDADYCGIGEEFSSNGAFKGTENVYYLGGGTGVADALKLNGKLVSFDECKNWISKTWEFKSKDGKSLENYISANGIQSLFSKLSNTPQKKLIEKSVFLEQILELAEENDSAALQCWKIVVQELSNLIYERICTVFCGWQNNFDFIDPNHISLQKNHNHIGTMLDKIVIGQRLGYLFKSPSAQNVIVQPLLSKLTILIELSNCLDDIVKSHYLKDGEFNPNILTFSNLREAPALGAGIDAWINYDNS